MSASTPSVYRRVLRRETRSPRSGIAITIAIVLILVSAWIGTESVFALLAQPALLVAPGDMLKAALTLPTAVPVVWLIIGGIVVAVIGLLLVITALKPGRRSRHTGETTRSAVVVDDRVIASSLARAAAHAGDLDADQVVVTLSRKAALVRVRPSSGMPVSRHEVVDAIDAELDTYNLSPALRTKVVVDTKGVVGK